MVEPCLGVDFLRGCGLAALAAALSCCAGNVVEGSSGDGAGGATVSAPAGGAGGASTTTSGAAGGSYCDGSMSTSSGGLCSAECISCCNQPACPPEPPQGGCDCENDDFEQPAQCAYVVDSCLQTWFCSKGDPDFWSMNTSTDCPGDCPAHHATTIYCLEVGHECEYQDSDGMCWLHTCAADHHWDSTAAECPP